MSTRRRKRRRARERRHETDAMDLFLDAICNTLGVVMFVLLVVATFAAPPEAPAAAAPVVDPSRLQALQREAEELRTEIDSLPPEGDPALLARVRALEESIREASARLDAALAATRADALRVAAANAAADAALEDAARTEREVASAEEARRREASRSQLVRVSRFRQDSRPALLLLVSGGRASRALVSPGQKELPPPTAAGWALDSERAVQAAIAQLLSGADPGRQRVEVGVWADSFPEYKRLERALVELGYDINPLPVEVGRPLRSGAGGVQ